MPVRNLDEARACAQRLLDGGLQRVIVTLGSNGSLSAEAGGMQHVAPFKVDAIDTTGAGDAFIGSLACFLASGYEERKPSAAPIFTPRYPRWEPGRKNRS